jgi:AcrR family transcriptional regulator
MSKTEEQTRERILMSALALFAQQGIGKTSLDEVAYQAGLTRVTVYRYFADKKDLVHKTFLRVERIFQDGLDDLAHDPNPDQITWETAMVRIGQGLSALPRSDVFARSEELKRLYPDVYAAVQDVRAETLNRMFDRFFAMAERQDLLRPGINREVVQSLYWMITLNIFENPQLRSFGLTDAELYHLITGIFLHGVLKS